MKVLLFLLLSFACLCRGQMPLMLRSFVVSIGGVDSCQYTTRVIVIGAASTYHRISYTLVVAPLVSRKSAVCLHCIYRMYMC